MATRAQIITEINTNLASGSNITAAELRTTLIDTVNSVPFLSPATLLGAAVAAPIASAGYNNVIGPITIPANTLTATGQSLRLVYNGFINSATNVNARFLINSTPFDFTVMAVPGSRTLSTTILFTRYDANTVVVDHLTGVGQAVGNGTGYTFITTTSFVWANSNTISGGYVLSGGSPGSVAYVGTLQALQPIP